MKHDPNKDAKSHWRWVVNGVKLLPRAFGWTIIAIVLIGVLLVIFGPDVRSGQPRP